ncbi:MAG: GFA family protein [Paracoccaceae bacterium]
MLKTYHGSCHCKAVTFEADLDLTQGTSRCNCSICAKLRNWTARTTPDHFRLIKAEALGEFFPAPDHPNAHCFCTKCGVRVFSRGDIPEIGGAFVTVAIAALDDATAEEIIAAPLVWCDGLHDNWWNAPAEARHL